jgi:hypothetical protein
MSHLHSITGSSRAAAEYQEYLERLRAERLAEQEEKLRKKARAQRYESFNDPDRPRREKSHQNPGREAGTDPVIKADPPEGFGTRYA